MSFLHFQTKVIWTQYLFFVIKHNFSFFNSPYYVFFIFSIFCQYTNICCKITVFIFAIDITILFVCAFGVIVNSCYWYFISSWIKTGILHWQQIPMFGCLQWCQLATNIDTACLLICMLHSLWTIPNLFACWQTVGSTDCVQTHNDFFLSFRINSNYFSILCWRIGLHKQETACFLRGRNRLFKYSLP